jgi:serine protease Do
VLPGTPDVAALVEKVRPSVVNITAIQELHIAGGGGGDPFEFFFGRKLRPSEPPQDVVRQRALGSGFILDASGHVITNAHVVEDAKTVRVRLADDREFAARLKGRDTRLDLALLEIQGAKDLPPAALGSSEELRVGEYVVAIGNPFGLGNTVTMGIVSAKSRELGAGPYDDFIQTDASINPGNSGGPLFNLKGQVVGINAAINPAARGIGFAIPIDALKEVLPQLLSVGHVSRGRLGVAVQGMDAALAGTLGLERPRGALVAEVEADGPGAKAGLKSGDVILRVDANEVAHAHDLPRFVARHPPGSRVKLDVWRDKTHKTIEATLAELKDEESGAPPEAPPSPAQPQPQQGELGLELEDDAQLGVVVKRVLPEGPAVDQLEAGDVILEVNRSAVKTAREAMQRLRDSKTPMIKFRRQGRVGYVAIERKK